MNDLVTRIDNANQVVKHSYDLAKTIADMFNTVYLIFENGSADVKANIQKKIDSLKGRYDNLQKNFNYEKASNSELLQLDAKLEEISNELTPLYKEMTEVSKNNKKKAAKTVGVVAGGTLIAGIIYKCFKK